MLRKLEGRRLALLLTAILLFSCSLALAQGGESVKVMVVTGGHPYDPSFESLFEGYDDITALICPHPLTFGRDLWMKQDVLVLYDLVQEIPDTARDNLKHFVESGKGVVVLHHAVADYNSWTWWYRDVVGGRYLVAPEAGTPASTYKWDQKIVVRPVGKNPITQGIGPLHLVEETYKGMWLSPGAKPLLVTDHPTSDKVVAWISPYAKSRVVAIQMGHDRKSHAHPGYRALVRNAILWSAGRLPRE